MQKRLHLLLLKIPMDIFELPVSHCNAMRNCALFSNAIRYLDVMMHEPGAIVRYIILSTFGAPIVRCIFFQVVECHALKYFSE